MRKTVRAWHGMAWRGMSCRDMAGAGQVDKAGRLLLPGSVLLLALAVFRSCLTLILDQSAEYVAVHAALAAFRIWPRYLFGPVPGPALSCLQRPSLLPSLAPCSLLVAPSPSCDSVAPSFAVPPCLHRAANTSPPRRLLEVCPPQPPAFAFGSSSFSLPRLLLPLLLSLLHHKTRNHPWIWRHPHPGPYPALPAAAPAAPPRCHACPTTPVVPGSSVPSAHALVAGAAAAIDPDLGATQHRGAPPAVGLGTGQGTARCGFSFPLAPSPHLAPLPHSWDHTLFRTLSTKAKAEQERHTCMSRWLSARDNRLAAQDAALQPVITCRRIGAESSPCRSGAHAWSARIWSSFISHPLRCSRPSHAGPSDTPRITPVCAHALYTGPALPGADGSGNATAPSAFYPSDSFKTKDSRESKLYSAEAEVRRTSIAASNGPVPITPSAPSSANALPTETAAFLSLPRPASPRWSPPDRVPGPWVSLPSMCAHARPASFDCEPPDRDDSSTLVLGAKPANPPPAANSVAEPGICLVGLKDALDSLTGRLNQRLWIE
ncbi:hypothetical protein PCL_05865 [Purpureocillium lilacinum]|uniref:Uncharacterized protein n=1 Tax=Purpureocillium lilacinum TaxID=33203 RepID=A0A2U3EL15_PURLI|nr:hypothetical protein PCL_05865 [Purpureocillium lilacinum]